MLIIYLLSMFDVTMGNSVWRGGSLWISGIVYPPQAENQV